MKTIWKFPLHIDDAFSVVMPRGAKLLTVQSQQGAPMLWALVDPDAEKVQRGLAMRGTGHPCDGNVSADGYVGTFQAQGGALVFHLFDLGEL